jgi:hypothetical protein
MEPSPAAAVPRFRLADEPWLIVAGEVDEYSYKSLIGTLASGGFCLSTPAQGTCT